MLQQYTYVFAIGTLFALLDAYNNGASKQPTLPSSSPPIADPKTPHKISPTGTRLILTASALADRRCCQLVGYQCLVEIHLLPTGHDLWHHL
jgi:hypothetical protein